LLALSGIKILDRIVHRARTELVILAWGVSISSFTLSAILQGLLIPSRYYGAYTGAPFPLGIILFYIEIFGVSILASIVLDDAAGAVLGLFASYVLAIILTYLALSLPTSEGAYPPAALTGAAIVFTFTALFPFPILATLVGTLVGVGLSERFSRRTIGRTV
jgi:hypothetical protein